MMVQKLIMNQDATIWWQTLRHAENQKKARLRNKVSELSKQGTVQWRGSSIKRSGEKQSRTSYRLAVQISTHNPLLVPLQFSTLGLDFPGKRVLITFTKKPLYSYPDPYKRYVGTKHDALHARLLTNENINRNERSAATRARPSRWKRNLEECRREIDKESKSWKFETAYNGLTLL